MTLPLALYASSYNDSDASGSVFQDSKTSYIEERINTNTHNLATNHHNNHNNNNNNIKNNKNTNNNHLRKTIKQKPNLPNQTKLSALLKSMDEASDSDNDNEDNNLVNYTGGGGGGGGTENNGKKGSQMFPPLPEMNYRGPYTTISQQSANSNATSYQSPDTPVSSGSPVSKTDYDNMPSSYANQYYKQYVPYLNQGSSEMPEESKSDLIEKLNYIIDLLEEQQDYKTNSILEDLILYTFLGIFVIFIVDSFSRSGKYVR